LTTHADVVEGKKDIRQDFGTFIYAGLVNYEKPFGMGNLYISSVASVKLFNE